MLLDAKKLILTLKLLTILFCDVYK